LVVEDARQVRHARAVRRVGLDALLERSLRVLPELAQNEVAPGLVEPGRPAVLVDRAQEVDVGAVLDELDGKRLLDRGAVIGEREADFVARHPLEDDVLKLHPILELEGKLEVLELLDERLLARRLGLPVRVERLLRLVETLRRFGTARALARFVRFLRTGLRPREQGGEKQKKQALPENDDWPE